MHDRLRDLLRRRHLAAIGLVAVSVPALGGCAAASAPQPTPLPAPSLTQEQQDDKAFEDLFARYDGLPANTDSEADLAPLLTGDALESEKSSLTEARESKQTIEGVDTYGGFAVTDHGVDEAGAAYMVAQVCVDVSGTRIIDASGADITPARDSRLSLQLRATRVDDTVWKISDIVRNEDVHACD